MIKAWMGTYVEKGVALTNPDSYFNMFFDKSLILTDFSRRLIENVNGTKVISEVELIHPDRGRIAVEHLASGVKTILLAMYNPEVITNVGYCGDNCIPYLIEASSDKDITIVMERLIDFYDEELYGTKIDSMVVLNDNRGINSDIELFLAWADFQYDKNEVIDGKVHCYKRAYEPKQFY